MTTQEKRQAIARAFLEKYFQDEEPTQERINEIAAFISDNNDLDALMRQYIKKEVKIESVSR